jgi:hypothetical protein
MDDTRKLVASINAAYGEGALEDGRVQASFDKWWPELQGTLAAIPPPTVAKPKVDATQQIVEMTAEILTRVRELDKVGTLTSARMSAAADFDFERLIASIRKRRDEAAQLGRTDLVRVLSNAESTAAEGKQRYTDGDIQEGKKLYGRALSTYKDTQPRF